MILIRRILKLRVFWLQILFFVVVGTLFGVAGGKTDHYLTQQFWETYKDPASVPMVAIGNINFERENITLTDLISKINDFRKQSFQTLRVASVHNFVTVPYSVSVNGTELNLDIVYLDEETFNQFSGGANTSHLIWTGPFSSLNRLGRIMLNFSFGSIMIDPSKDMRLKERINTLGYNNLITTSLNDLVVFPLGWLNETSQEELEFIFEFYYLENFEEMSISEFKKFWDKETQQILPLWVSVFKKPPAISYWMMNDFERFIDQEQRKFERNISVLFKVLFSLEILLLIMIYGYLRSQRELYILLANRGFSHGFIIRKIWTWSTLIPFVLNLLILAISYNVFSLFFPRLLELYLPWAVMTFCTSSFLHLKLFNRFREEHQMVLPRKKRFLQPKENLLKGIEISLWIAGTIVFLFETYQYLFGGQYGIPIGVIAPFATQLFLSGLMLRYFRTSLLIPKQPPNLFRRARLRTVQRFGLIRVFLMVLVIVQSPLLVKQSSLTISNLAGGNYDIELLVNTESFQIDSPLDLNEISGIEKYLSTFWTSIDLSFKIHPDTTVDILLFNYSRYLDYYQENATMEEAIYILPAFYYRLHLESPQFVSQNRRISLWDFPVKQIKERVDIPLITPTNTMVIMPISIWNTLTNENFSDHVFGKYNSKTFIRLNTSTDPVVFKNQIIDRMGVENPDSFSVFTPPVIEVQERNPWLEIIVSILLLLFVWLFLLFFVVWPNQFKKAMQLVEEKYGTSEIIVGEYIFNLMQVMKDVVLSLFISIYVFINPETFPYVIPVPSIDILLHHIGTLVLVLAVLTLAAIFFWLFYGRKQES